MKKKLMTLACNVKKGKDKKRIKQMRPLQANLKYNKKKLIS